MRAPPAASAGATSSVDLHHAALPDAPNLPVGVLPPSRGGVWSRQTLNPSTFKDRHPTDEEYLQMAKAEPSRKYRKLEEAMARNENKKMRTAALESEWSSRDERVIESDSSSARPPPKFSCGQSVHHWWASWMCSPEKAPKQLKKKARPAWFSAQIATLPQWETGVYAGVEYTGWHYTAH